ncbi:MAG: ribosomal protein S18-alanine N-acetyltransferase [Deltaproteobacteria bacterium]|nr:ribosomal protein S18-alanine N-acetyltransferase [Deltaproteobacteria bacterium]
MTLSLRPIKKEDIPAILEIEKQSFPEPYSEAVFQDELKITCSNLWVAEINSQLAGYIDFWIIHDEVELISIAVHPNFRRQHIAETLMNQMIQMAQTKNIHIIYLDVRESNLAAKSLYERFGFKQVGVRKRYYKNNHENALIMVKEL